MSAHYLPGHDEKCWKIPSHFVCAQKRVEHLESEVLRLNALWTQEQMGRESGDASLELLHARHSKTVDYNICLQRAIETHCRGEYIKGEMAKNSPQLTGKLNARLEELIAHRDKARGDYWAWQGDSYDYPESLVCPVLISADALRHLLAESKRLQKVLTEICDELYGHGFDVLGWHMNGASEPLDSWFDDNGWCEAADEIIAPSIIGLHGPAKCGRTCDGCDGEHHWIPTGMPVAADDSATHPAIAAGFLCWYVCKHCDTWCEDITEAEETERME